MKKIGLIDYHKTVFDNIKRFMINDEIDELKKACSVI